MGPIVSFLFLVLWLWFMAFMAAGLGWFDRPRNWIWIALGLAVVLVTTASVWLPLMSVLIRD
jgi:hypothetical protein